MKKTNLLVGAAVLGMLSAVSVSQAVAADSAPTDGKCVGANTCGGKGACKTDANDCAGKNGCKGKGWVKMSQKKCEAKGKKNSKIHWEANS